MGRATVNRFARLVVMPQTGHGLSGANYPVDGKGRATPAPPIPNRYDQVGSLFDWIERGEKSLPLCSYPAYPRYQGGSPAAATSYVCARL